MSPLEILEGASWATRLLAKDIVNRALNPKEHVWLAIKEKIQLSMEFQGLSD